MKRFWHWLHSKRLSPVGEQKQSDRLRFNVKKNIQWREYMKKNRLRAKQHSLRKTINIYESFYLLLETELLTNFCIWNEWIYVRTGGPESSGTWRTVSSCLQVRVRANWTCKTQIFLRCEDSKLHPADQRWLKGIFRCKFNPWSREIKLADR